MPSWYIDGISKSLVRCRKTKVPSTLEGENVVLPVKDSDVSRSDQHPDVDSFVRGFDPQLSFVVVGHLFGSCSQRVGYQLFGPPVIGTQCCLEFT